MAIKLNVTPSQNPDATVSPNDNIGVTIERSSGRNVLVISIPDNVRTGLVVKSDDRATTIESVVHRKDGHDLASITLHKDYGLIESNRRAMKFSSPEEMKDFICKMYADGMTETEISKLTGIPQTTVSYIIRTWKGKV